MSVDHEAIKEAVRKILIAVGEDPDRTLLDTAVGVSREGRKRQRRHQQAGD